MDLTGDSWLTRAENYISQIWQARSLGKPGNQPFCIFDIGKNYLQFLARFDEPRLICECVSAQSVPAVAEVLTPNKVGRLIDLGFKQPRTSPNYSQEIRVKTENDLGSVAQLAYQVLSEVYGVQDFSRASFQVSIPTP